MGGGTADKPDTTVFRIARDVGFNARVEPIWFTFTRLSARMGFLERWKEKRRTQKRIAAVNGALRGQGVPLDGWETRTGDCVCNLRVAKLGLLSELKRFVRNGVEVDAEKEWPHLMALRDQATLLVPADFAVPQVVTPGRGEDALAVASGPRLKAELAKVDEWFRISQTFAIKKMVDFLDATDRDISIYESRFGTQEGFWAMFVFVLLRKLTDRGGEHRLPVIFA